MKELVKFVFSFTLPLLLETIVFMRAAIREGKREAIREGK